MRPRHRLVVTAGVIAVLLVALAAVPLLADIQRSSATDDGFVIDAFDRAVDVRTDGTVAVTETLAVSFLEPRRGIIREFDPDGLGGVDATYDVLRVDRGSPGDRWPYAVEDNGMRVRVGDEDVELDPGPQTYRITYLATGQVAQDAEEPAVAELRVDVPGSGWPTEVRTTTATIELPAAPDDVVCVVGDTGSRTPCPDAEVTGTTVVQQLPALAAGETGTVSIRLDADVFTDADLPTATLTPLDAADDPAADDADGQAADPAPWSQLPRWLKGLVLGLAGAAPILLFEALRARFVYRDEITDRSLHERPTPLRVYSPPDGLRPAEVAALVPRVGDTEDRFLATLVDLEQRQVLTSAATTKDGSPPTPSMPIPSHRSRRAPKGAAVTKVTLRAGSRIDQVAPFEGAFVDALLADSTSVTFDGSYDQDLARRVQAAQQVLTDHGGSLLRPGGGLVHDRGHALRGVRGWLFGTLAVVVGAILAVLAAWMVGLPMYLGAVTIALLLAAWFVLALVWDLQRLPLTSQGRDLVRRARAFRRFLRQTQASQARTGHAQTAQVPPVMELLPYAIVFGLGSRWYEHYTPLLVEQVSRTPGQATPTGGMVIPWWAYTGGFLGVKSARSGSVTHPAAGAGTGAGAGSGAGGGGGGSW